MAESGFYTELSESSRFDGEIIEKSLAMSEKLRAAELEAAFFSEGTPKMLKNGTLFFKDSLYPVQFYKSARLAISESGISFEEGFLYLYILFMPRSYRLFRSLGFSDEIFFETMSSISTAAKQFRRENGFCGTYDYIWQCNHLRANVIRLGSFEYQNGVYGFNERITLGEKTIKCGDRAVFLHVPFGTDFSKSARLLSYKKAADMFGGKFLICDSWLLHPANRELPDENSNIRSFAEDFFIFHIDDTVCREDLYRIFGRNCNFKDISSLPRETRLQKIYAERIEKGLPTGSAAGARLL